MSDYAELIKELRYCKDDAYCSICSRYEQGRCFETLHNDAAAAIEDLQTDIKRLKESNEELREAQTYIDHYGDKWMTSAKDVPTAAYEHGYADGRDEAEAQLPKHGEWVEENRRPRSSQFVCSECHRTAYDPQPTRDKAWKKRCRYAYCPNCGAKMEVQE